MSNETVIDEEPQLDMKEKEYESSSITVLEGLQAVSEATGKDCGCKARRDALNRAFPYNK